MAIKEVAMAGTPVILEPVSLVEVTAPSDHLGDVLGDLNARRGRVQGTAPGDFGEQVVLAHVPLDELRTYATDLRSITGGRGRFSATHAHYDVVPPAAGPLDDPAGVPARR
jgi:elongation factor G